PDSLPGLLARIRQPAPGRCPQPTAGLFVRRSDRRGVAPDAVALLSASGRQLPRRRAGGDGGTTSGDLAPTAHGRRAVAGAAPGADRRAGRRDRPRTDLFPGRFGRLLDVIGVGTAIRPARLAESDSPSVSSL